MHTTNPRPIKFGDYVLLVRLGQGGMGEVWKAVRRDEPDRVVVLKRVLPHLLSDPDVVDMFAREARLCARLMHPNVVQMREFGEVGGEYFLAMDYVAGVDLWRLMREQRRHGPIDPGFAAYVMSGICSALDYAYRLPGPDGRPLHIIHRDVSPTNVMLSFDGQTKLLDFGIAKALSSLTEKHTQTGMLRGKFSYMSPEQVEGGRRPDHRSDQFAAGIVLHELLTGTRLFRGESDIDTIALVRAAEVARPSALNPQVPRELDDICLRALARDPVERHADCGELAARLAELAARLGWDAGRSARLLEELFPGGATDVTRVSLQLAANSAEGTASVSIDNAGVQRHASRGRRTTAIAAAVAATAVLAAVAFISRRPVVAVPAAGPAAVAPAVAAPATVKVEIVSAPPGADLFMSGEAASRGQTPLTLDVPRGVTAQEVSLRRDGYEAAIASFTPDRDSRLQVTLARATAVARVDPPVRAVATRGTPPKMSHVRAAQKAQARPPEPVVKPKDLRRGAVVDPFGS